MTSERTSNTNGLYSVPVGNHRDCPYSTSSGQCIEARYVWWKNYPGDLIKSDEEIHHINGDPTDNHIENLIKLTKSKHLQAHGRKSHRKPYDSYTKYALNYNGYMRLMLACRTTEQTCLIGLACEMGFRRDDIVSLEVSNIDIRNKKITFLENKKNRMRTLPLPDQQIQDIIKHLNTFKKQPRFLFPAKRTSKTGHMSGMEAWRTLQELCLQADIPAPADRKDRPFHALRGTCYKLKQNRDKWTVEQAAAWLGDTPETAMRHYGKTTESELETLVRREKE
jgi:integrase